MSHQTYALRASQTDVALLMVRLMRDSVAVRLEAHPLWDRHLLTVAAQDAEVTERALRAVRTATQTLAWSAMKARRD